MSKKVLNLLKVFLTFVFVVSMFACTLTVNFASAEKLEFSGIKCFTMAASQVGAPQIRNRGTVGGNIISASPAADSVPAV